MYKKRMKRMTSNDVMRRKVHRSDWRCDWVARKNIERTAGMDRGNLVDLLNTATARLGRMRFLFDRLLSDVVLLSSHPFDGHAA
jgi:ribosomal protein L20